ncbi:MAG: hypothetical protein HQK59_12450 [Deltaproteobacteria bacterium]|nr:hypothetical protein [Deltaproteobacteria bacterium]
MKQEEVLEQLTLVATALRIKVKFENLNHLRQGQTGGSYILRGEEHILVNSKSSLSEQIKTLTSELKGRDLSSIYVKPLIREMIES